MENQPEQNRAEGHGLTSQEAREAGLGPEQELREGKDFVKEAGREIKEGKAVQHGSSQEASSPSGDMVNDDDTSQRMGRPDA